MKSKSNLPVLSLAAGLALALLAGCATSTTSPTVLSHPDATVAYGSYKSFALMRPSTRLPADRSSVVTPALIRQTREDTASAFAAKGLVQAPEDAADLLVLVHGGLQPKIDIRDSGFSYGRFGRGFAGSRYEIEQYKEGTLLIDVFDGKTRELVWRGSAVAEINDMPQPETVKTAIDAVVGRYPN